MDQPKRKVQLTVKIGADSWDDVVSELYAITNRIEREGPVSNLCSGGYSGSHIVIGSENPNQTGDKYRKENEEYCNYLKSRSDS